eukprot:COSAG06_NODE_19335_length_843_cov_1.049731_2_plen_122_part_01
MVTGVPVTAQRHRSLEPAEEAQTLTAPFVDKKFMLKTTLVLTKNSLLGQWQDEFKKYAPQLKVAVFYGSSAERSKIDSGVMDLSKVDVVSGTPTTFLPMWLQEVAVFPRVIVDESNEGCNKA